MLISHRPLALKPGKNFLSGAGMMHSGLPRFCRIQPHQADVFFPPSCQVFQGVCLFFSFITHDGRGDLLEMCLSSCYNGVIVCFSQIEMLFNQTVIAVLGFAIYPLYHLYHLSALCCSLIDSSSLAKTNKITLKLMEKSCDSKWDVFLSFAGQIDERVNKYKLY